MIGTALSLTFLLVVAFLMISFPVSHVAAFPEMKCQVVGSLFPSRHSAATKAAQITHSVPPYLLDNESRTFVPFSATNRAVNDHLSQLEPGLLYRPSTHTSGLSGDMLAILSARKCGAGHHLRNSGAEDSQHVPTEAAGVGTGPIQEPGFQLGSYTEVLTRHLPP
jgi:hypothetical protein